MISLVSKEKLLKTCLALDEGAVLVVKPIHMMLVDGNVDAARSLAAFMGLPDMDGYVLVRSLKSRASNTNAVFMALTGYGQTHDKEMAFAAGFDYHFVKPIDMERLDTILLQIEVVMPDLA